MEYPHCSQVLPLQLKEKCTSNTTSKHRKSLKYGKKNVGYLGVSELEENLVVSSLSFLIGAYIFWTRWYRNLQPEASNRHRQKSSKENLFSLARGPRDWANKGKLFWQTCFTLAKLQWKNHTPSLPTHGVSGYKQDVNLSHSPTATPRKQVIQPDFPIQGW